jgi:hypothetical protein
MKENKFWFHWQNLNEDRSGRKHSPFRHGRCWWHFGYNKSICFSWQLGKIRFGLGATYGGDEDELTIQFEIPFISLFLLFENFIKNLRRGEEKHTGLSIFCGYISIDIGQDQMSYSPKRDKFRHIMINLPDLFLGRSKYSKQDLQKESVQIPMPEGSYPATVTLFESTWKRPRFPLKKKMVRAEIEIENGIPVPGKGENSWDCGEDAVYSLTAPVSSFEAAIAETVKTCLRDRRKYGGENWRPEAIKTQA